MTAFVNWFAATIGTVIPPQLAVSLVSLLPLIELRGGIVLGFMLKLPLWQSIVFSVIGNIIPIPFILLFIRKIFDWLRPTKMFGKIVLKLENRAMNKSDGIKKAEFIGLMLFVGISDNIRRYRKCYLKKRCFILPQDAAGLLKYLEIPGNG